MGCWLDLPELFLTSKVRLHCDFARPGDGFYGPAAFPDLKGQAPLRRLCRDGFVRCDDSFPDLKGQAPLRPAGPGRGRGRGAPPFPDLKGQAPLRQRHAILKDGRTTPFPDLKGQAPLRLPDDVADVHLLGVPFPDLKGQAPLRPVVPHDATEAETTPFPDLKGQVLHTSPRHPYTDS